MDPLGGAPLLALRGWAAAVQARIVHLAARRETVAQHAQHRSELSKHSTFLRRRPALTCEHTRAPCAARPCTANIAAQPPSHHGQ